MSKVETGLLSGGVPFVRGGRGERHAVVFFGGNALLRRLDKVSRVEVIARQVEDALPAGWRYTILGYRDFPPTDYTLGTVVDDFARVVPAETGEPDLLVGVSFGGFAAMRFAGIYPERVRRLVLLITAHRFSSNGRRMVARQMELLEKRDILRLAREYAPLFRRPWYNWALRLAIWYDRRRILAETRDPADVLRAFRSLFSPDFDRNLSLARRIRTPSLLLAGTADQYFSPRAFRETAEAIPGCRLQLVEGEAHMLPVERSATVRKAITAFVDETPAA